VVGWGGGAEDESAGRQVVVVAGGGRVVVVVVLVSPNFGGGGAGGWVAQGRAMEPPNPTLAGVSGWGAGWCLAAVGSVVGEPGWGEVASSGGGGGGGWR
jgi:hypothetical protein